MEKITLGQHVASLQLPGHTKSHKNVIDLVTHYYVNITQSQLRHGTVNSNRL